MLAFDLRRGVGGRCHPVPSAWYYSGNNKSHDGNYPRVTRWVNGLRLGNAWVTGAPQALRTTHVACI
jgi:hypothetical protein